MSHTLVVYGHPYNKSFNHAIFEAVTAGLDKAGKNYKVIDLHADGFDPNYSTEELSLYKKGETADPLVTAYQKLVDEGVSLLFLYAIWWSYLLTNFKGFFFFVFKNPWC